MKKIFCLSFFYLLTIIASKAQSWLPLNGGVYGIVRALYYDSLTDKLYAGGNFIFADSIRMRSIASWDGNKWDSLRNGMDGRSNRDDPGNVLAITRFQNKIYIGGAFYHPGELPVNNLATWDGINWDSLPATPNNSVVNFNVHSNELYVCGDFDSIGNNRYNGIAKFNGSSWSDVYSFPLFDSLPTNQNDIAQSIFFQNNLYVAGHFYADSSRRNITYWNGQRWGAVGSGVQGFFISWVNCMTIYKNELYVGGLFYQSDGNAGNSIMKWDGFNWTDVGGGIGGLQYPQVVQMKVYNDELYITGTFETAGSIPAHEFAKWDGLNWCAVDGNFSNGLQCIEFAHDSVYVGGRVDSIANNPFNGIVERSIASINDSCNWTGISENSFQNDVTVFPSPVTNYLIIKSKDSQSVSFEVLISDLVGRTVYFSKVDKQETKIIFDSFPAGTYYVEVKTTFGVIKKKILKL